MPKPTNSEKGMLVKLRTNKSKHRGIIIGSARTTPQGPQNTTYAMHKVLWPSVAVWHMAADLIEI